MKYAISACYNAGTTGYVEFPEGKTWDDVKDWFVKWDTLHVTFNDGTQGDFGLSSDTSIDIIDWKRPSYVSVHPTDETGNPDYDEEIAEL